MTTINPSLEHIIREYGFVNKPVSIQPITGGLINHTWKISFEEGDYILQQINDQVFTSPGDIDANLQMLATFLEKNHPGYFFVKPLATTPGATLVQHGEGYYRLFPFVKDSHTLHTVAHPGQAYEAALQFGSFTHHLKGFDISRLNITIPGFHDLSLRYRQFHMAIENGNPERVIETADLIRQLKGWSFLAEQFEKWKKDPAFQYRVTHHDTKISNVLFDDQEKGICVIDLDTVMPGYFFSDLGDMIRTYVSPVSEEEKDLSLVQVRKEYYAALLDGYREKMKDDLSAGEREHFFEGGCMMVYMQALRFLTDYLHNDPYYGAQYPGHNRLRAENQWVLLTRLWKMRKDLVALGKK
ncbi:MAG: phosphotransferase [Terrimonas sp.]|nr:phosphotransferase [Terrimonas sp.]